jgi:hypothetical protein
VFGLFASSHILKNTTFRKLDLFSPSGERVGDTYSVGSVTKNKPESLDLLALPNGPNRVSPTPSLEEGNRSSLRNIILFKTPDNVQKSSKPGLLIWMGLGSEDGPKTGYSIAQ